MLDFTARGGVGGVGFFCGGGRLCPEKTTCPKKRKVVQKIGSDWQAGSWHGSSVIHPTRLCESNCQSKGHPKYNADQDSLPTRMIRLRNRDAEADSSGDERQTCFRTRFRFGAHAVILPADCGEWHGSSAANRESYADDHAEKARNSARSFHSLTQFVS
jgi:hypothetical protein